jgi:hypothetical protein
VVALLIGVFLAGDVIHLLGYLAMILILSGVALLQYGSRQALLSAISAITEIQTRTKPKEQQSWT